MTMAAPSIKLAESLLLLRNIQKEERVAIRSSLLPRSHRERLVREGFLKEVMKGWYIPTRPEESAGETTSWYASYWRFVADYLDARFAEEWSLNPEQSLCMHVGNKTVPAQLMVRSPRAANRITQWLHGTSLLEVRAALPKAGEGVEREGLRLFSLASGLIHAHSDFFSRNPTDARAALLMISGSSEILSPLLEGGHSVAAGRLAGAFRNVGRDRIAEEIMAGMKSADFNPRMKDPFVGTIQTISLRRGDSPQAARLKVLWTTMRQQVLEVFPPPPGIPKDIEAYMSDVEENYTSDAYNSLSIEGYRVSTELIERVRSGKWNPVTDRDDRERRDAMAARGYWQAFQSVKKTVRRILDGADPGITVDQDHGEWFREMFSPSVVAGIIKPADLAGYRDIQVFIRGSYHIPPPAHTVRDLMPLFFELLSEEKEAAVRVVLGHFIFVYIHPYRDGNGRMGRFLMNAMLASGGYPWTVVPFSQRDGYMSSLESASTSLDIRPFALFLSKLLERV
jgi:hypothetical protein